MLTSMFFFLISVLILISQFVLIFYSLSYLVDNENRRFRWHQSEPFRFVPAGRTAHFISDQFLFQSLEGNHRFSVLTSSDGAVSIPASKCPPASEPPTGPGSGSEPAWFAVVDQTAAAGAAVTGATEGRAGEGDGCQGKLWLLWRGVMTLLRQTSRDFKICWETS